MNALEESTALSRADELTIALGIKTVSLDASAETELDAGQVSKTQIAEPPTKEQTVPAAQAVKI